MGRFSYTNKYGRTYYLHIARGSDGRMRHVMRLNGEAAASELPPGFEVRENVHGQVSVRRQRKRWFRPLERQLLRTAMQRFRPFAYALDIEGKTATVYASAEDRKCFLGSLDAEFAHGFADALTKALAKRYSPELVEMFRARQQEKKAKRPAYYPLLRFVLTDEQDRRFAVERVCFTGESAWVRLETLPLSAALSKYLPHLGRESFFDLI
ncbi:MAG: hypothetical protein KGY81_07575 [Phycisphaerae bacterium]|nr:hypothetical protein [Phycisphaerae bacterium]